MRFGVSVVTMYFQLICVCILFLGTVQGNLTPDNPLQIDIEQPMVGNGTAIRMCLPPPKVTMNVRFQTFNTKAGTTFVRRVVSDQFGACYLDFGQQLPASSFSSCSAVAEKAGLKMFKFTDGDGICTGYPVGITEEQQGCTGSGTTVFYTTPGTNARANRRREFAPSQAFKSQATQRIEAMSTDVIVDYDGFKTIEGKGLSSSQAYKEVEVLNRCQCHYYCSTDSACNAYSVRELTPGQNDFLCSLANDDVYTNTPTSVAASYYAVRADLVEEHALDNLIYRRLGSPENGFDAHVAACQAIPGFRLVAPRFQAQMPILLELCLGHPPNPPNQDCPNTFQEGWFFVDIVKGPLEPLIRGVLPVSETNLISTTFLINDGPTHTVFIYAKDLQLHDETTTRLNTKPVCQANVFGVNW